MPLLRRNGHCGAYDLLLPYTRRNGERVRVQLEIWENLRTENLVGYLTLNKRKYDVFKTMIHGIMGKKETEEMELWQLKN